MLVSHRFLRELIDGRAGSDRDDVGDERLWVTHLGRLTVLAQRFRAKLNGSGPSRIDRNPLRVVAFTRRPAR